MFHRKNHWICCWKPIIGNVLWVAAAVSLIFAWVSIYKNAAIQTAASINETKPYENALVFGLEPLAWYWNALLFGVLAIGKKISNENCSSCEADDSQE